jgi:hypothetical protein
MLNHTIHNAEMTEHGLRITLFAGEEGVYPTFYLTDFVCIPTKYCEPLIKSVNLTYFEFMSGEFDDFQDNLKKELIKEGVFKVSGNESKKTTEKKTEAENNDTKESEHENNL